LRSCAILPEMDYEEADRILSCVMDVLRQERERRGLSLKQFGVMSGVERTSIAKAENGQRSPSLLTCLRLADALGLRLGDVLNSIPAKKRRK
jgi:transcriptional regulator with XRE-family HTH domain